jgi:hypothetical protein
VRTARGRPRHRRGIPATTDLDAEALLGRHGDIAEVADSVDTLVKHALENRPDLAAAQATYAAALQRTRLVKSARLPSISASGSPAATSSFPPVAVAATSTRWDSRWLCRCSTASAGSTTPARRRHWRVESARTASLAQQVHLPGVRGAMKQQRTATQRVRTSAECWRGATGVRGGGPGAVQGGCRGPDRPACSGERTGRRSGPSESRPPPVVLRAGPAGARRGPARSRWRRTHSTL